MILGRQEAFAAKSSVGLAAADAIGMGAGFAFALLALGSLREMLGSGSLFGISLFGPHFEPWVIMLLPPGGFLSLGLMLLLLNWARSRRAVLSRDLVVTPGNPSQ
jgi:electron transport complex protein RnfE